MYVMEYWEQFKPIDHHLHYLMAFLYSLIALISFFTNIMVIIYLAK